MARNAKGQFAPGPDPDRRLWDSETGKRAGRKGWRAAIIKHARTPVGLWLRERVRFHYCKIKAKNLKKK